MHMLTLNVFIYFIRNKIETNNLMVGKVKFHDN